MAEVDHVKPRSMYVEEAIQAALESRWQDALAINRALVERHGTDEETCNRLGKALTELGDHQQALESYSQALQMNPMNVIAQKNVRKLQLLLDSQERLAGLKGAFDMELFAEEPGKSVLTVLNPPKTGLTVTVAPGEVVELHIHEGGLQAQTARGLVLGDVDSKIARRLIPLIVTGNRYTAAVARIAESQIEIIVREAFQAPENLRKSSFPVSRQRREDFRPYAKDSLLARRDDEDGTEFEEEEDGVSGVPAAGEELEPLAVAGDVDAEETAPLEEADGDAADDADDDVRPEDQY